MSMQPKPVLGADEIDVAAPDFWIRPTEEREGAFQTLRRERPIPFSEEPQANCPLAEASTR